MVIYKKILMDKWLKIPFIYPDKEKIAELLIVNGANVSIANKFKETPLHIAAKKGNSSS